MTDADQPPSPERLPDVVADGDRAAALACLDRVRAADADTRKRALQSLRPVASERPNVFDGLADSVEAFLTDENRAVRLTTAKLFVALARAEPAVVLPVVDTLADRLADDGAFYYVRARSAEALGYVGREHPEAVDDPEILADFRVGLSFDEPEVRAKLAKALASVALGDPSRLRRQVEALSAHLDDENERVRYHLCTALVAVGCTHPAKLTPGRDALVARLSDAAEDPYVRGRAAEALGLLRRAAEDSVAVPDDIDTGEDAAEFVRSRLAFLRATERPAESDGRVGTLDSLRAGTDDVVDAMTTPDEDECPHCGLAISDGGPPTCPRCGAPR